VAGRCTASDFAPGSHSSFVLECENGVFDILLLEHPQQGRLLEDPSLNLMRPGDALVDGKKYFFLPDIQQISGKRGEPLHMLVGYSDENGQGEVRIKVHED
jgi:hypothetical protein